MSRDNPNDVNEQPPASSGDFGVKSDEESAERDYAGRTVKQFDQGGLPERSGSAGRRVSGVGGNDSGRGSSSGGDVDTGDDALAGLTDHDADPPTDKPTASSHHDVVVGNARPADIEGVDVDGNTGAGNVNNPARDDDAFAGEITPGEVLGQG